MSSATPNTHPNTSRAAPPVVEGTLVSFGISRLKLVVFAFFPFLERTPSEVLSQYERRSIQAADQ
jgi:hypothetical protein